MPRMMKIIIMSVNEMMMTTMTVKTTENSNDTHNSDEGNNNHYHCYVIMAIMTTIMTMLYIKTGLIAHDSNFQSELMSLSCMLSGCSCQMHYRSSQCGDKKQKHYYYNDISA